MDKRLSRAGGDSAHRGARTDPPWTSVLGLLVFLLLSAVAGTIGALANVGAIPGWYATLVRPPLTPPDAVFGPVWTVLYVMMAVAAWLVWRERGRVTVALPLALYLVQLALNAVWSVLFFGMHSPGIALVEIVALWSALVMTTVGFARVRPLAALLMLPYLAWVSFAAYLNLGFWRLNG